MYTRLNAVVLLPVALTVIILRIFCTILKDGVTRRNPRVESLMAYLRNVGLYHIFGTLSVAQLQLLNEPWPDLTRRFCEKRMIKHEKIVLRSKVSRSNALPCCLLGEPSTAKAVLLFFHGGGFVMPGVIQHLQLLERIMKWSDGSIAIFCPAYSLAPDFVYPTQLAECVQALLYIQDRFPASEILFGGDSAGANLVLALISHLAHPHERSDIVRTVDLQKRISGAFVIGPWLANDISSVQATHAELDIVKPEVANSWFSLYQGPEKIDPYILPFAASTDWWKPAGDIVQHMLVTAGSNEVLCESIVLWYQRYRSVCGDEKITLVVGDDEIHDHPLWPIPDSDLSKKSAFHCQEAALRRWIQEKTYSQKLP